jgi:hypothetical protein
VTQRTYTETPGPIQLLSCAHNCHPTLHEIAPVFIAREIALQPGLQTAAPSIPPTLPYLSPPPLPVVFHANHNHTLPCGTRPCRARRVSECYGVGAVADGAWEAGGGRGTNRRAQRSYSPACTARVRAGPAAGWTVAMRLSSDGIRDGLRIGYTVPHRCARVCACVAIRPGSNFRLQRRRGDGCTAGWIADS